MPEATVIRSQSTARPRQAGRRGGPEQMPNNGRGRIPAARTADKTVVGARKGRLTHSTAEGGPAAPLRENRRGQGGGEPRGETGPEPMFSESAGTTYPQIPARRA